MRLEAILMKRPQDIYRIIDAGETWATVYALDSMHISSLFCLNNDTCYLSGFNGDHN